MTHKYFQIGGTITGFSAKIKTLIYCLVLAVALGGIIWPNLSLQAAEPERATLKLLPYIDGAFAPEALSLTVTVQDNTGGFQLLPSEHILHFDAQLLQEFGYTYFGYEAELEKRNVEGRVLDYVSVQFFLLDTDDVPTIYGTSLPIIKHTLTYTSTGHTEGMPPVSAEFFPGAEVIVESSGGLARTNFWFGGWQSGTTIYQPGQTFTMPGGDVTLTAIWYVTAVTGPEPIDPDELPPVTPPPITPPPITPDEEEDEEEEEGGTIPPQPPVTSPDEEDEGAPDIADPLPNIPPAANPDLLVPDGNGNYVEFDEAGVPLGFWSWDPEEDTWIFDENIPLASMPPESRMPQTGLINNTYALVSGLLVSAMVTTSVLFRIRKSRRSANV